MDNLTFTTIYKHIVCATPVDMIVYYSLYYEISVTLRGSYSHIFKLKLLNIENVTFHCLKHSFRA
jgi:hypothetical protein